MSEKEKIKLELEKLAPSLNSVSREPFYQVPERYFDSLADRNIKKVNNADGYQLPDGYFDNLQARVQKEVTPQHQVKSRKIYYMASGIAASFLLIAAFFLTQENVQHDINSDTYVSNSEEYILDNIDDYDIDDLVAESDFESLDIDDIELATIESFISENLDDFDAVDLL